MLALDVWAGFKRTNERNRGVSRPFGVLCPMCPLVRAYCSKSRFSSKWRPCFSERSSSLLSARALHPSKFHPPARESAPFGTILDHIVAYGQTRPFWISTYLTLCAQPLRRAVRSRDCDLPRSPVSSTQSRLLRLREIAGDRNLDPGPHIRVAERAE